MKNIFIVLVSVISLAFALEVGVGIWDVTGPAAEVGMMGYAKQGQNTKGIHLRQRARAFVFKDGETRLVYVSSDTCMIFHPVKVEVINQLAAKYQDLYTFNNVMLSGIHTHSGAAGYSDRPIYNLVSLGFQKDNFQAIADGIVSAIIMAHENMHQNATIAMATGHIDDANINRSQAAYPLNPEEERARYPDGDTDKIMTLLRIDAGDKELGLINWFAVHGTSMTNKNRYLSGDNKGTASYLVEKQKNGNDAEVGKGPFIAAFGQTNEGDVSPNTKGAFCPDGTPCEQVSSTCGGKTEGCNAIGPGKDEFDSCRIIGEKQANMALQLHQTASTDIYPEGSQLSYVHTFVDFHTLKVSANYTNTKKDETTCVGALGDSFAGGTTDGPGDFNFVQGPSNNPVWNFIGHFLSEPTKAEKECQHPKPILLNTGGVKLPVQWTPNDMPLQVFRIGNFFIVAVPGEFTTMSGRRLRETVGNVIDEHIDGCVKSGKCTVVIAGLANEYSHYITTYEEFQLQRYEAGSTLFGPHTLAGYQQEYAKLVEDLLTGVTPYPGNFPEDISRGRKIAFQPGIVLDTGNFGKILNTVLPSYLTGQNVVVEFQGADPRNNFMTQDSFCDVEMKQADGSWKIVRRDGDLSTKFTWQRSHISESICTCEWDIETNTLSGTYRIRHTGYHKTLSSPKKYTSTCSEFTVTNPNYLDVLSN